MISPRWPGPWVSAGSPPWVIPWRHGRPAAVQAAPLAGVRPGAVLHRAQRPGVTAGEAGRPRAARGGRRHPVESVSATGERRGSRYGAAGPRRRPGHSQVGPHPAAPDHTTPPLSRPSRPSARSPRTVGSARSMSPPRWWSRPGTASCRLAVSCSWPGRSRAHRCTRWTLTKQCASPRRRYSPGHCCRHAGR